MEDVQSHLVVEFRLHGIASIEGSNAFLPSLIEWHNAKFSVLILQTRHLLMRSPAE